MLNKAVEKEAQNDSDAFSNVVTPSNTGITLTKGSINNYFHRHLLQYLWQDNNSDPRNRDPCIGLPNIPVIPDTVLPTVSNPLFKLPPA